MTSSGFSFNIASADDIKDLILMTDQMRDAVIAEEESATTSRDETVRDRVSVEFRNCKEMPWKGKGLKKKKLKCFMNLARGLESGDSEAFLACKKKNFIRDKKNCFRDLAQSLQTNK